MFIDVDPRVAVARYRAIGNSMVEGVVVFDADGVVLACNARAELILGSSSRAIVGRRVDDNGWRLLGEDGLPLSSAERPDLLTLRSGEVVKRSIVGVERGDGRLVWLSVSTSPLCLDDSPAPAGVVATLLDISEQQSAKESLLESEQRFRQAFDNAPVGMVIYSTDGRVLSANPWLCRMMGYSEEELRALSPVQWTPPEDLEREACLLSRLLRGEVDSVCLEKTLLCRDGLRLVVRKNLSAVRNAQSRPLKLVGQLEDISSLKAAQSEAFSLRVIATQEGERKRIAHELHDEIGQSLTALKMALSRAQRSADDRSTRTSLAQAQSIVENLMGEVRDIAHRLRPPELDELGLPAGLRSLLECALTPAGLAFVFSENVGESRFAADIELCCFRVVQEAATNCLRHARANKFVVSLQQTADCLLLRVVDDGVGFELGQQAASTSLGLVGMRERVKAAAGKLVINSSPGLGTEIVASFTVAPRV